MKARMSDHGSLKGVGISILAAKGKTEKNLERGTRQSRLQGVHADSADKLIKLARPHSVQALIVDWRTVRSLFEKWEEDAGDRENLAGKSF